MKKSTAVVTKENSNQSVPKAFAEGVIKYLNQ